MQKSNHVSQQGMRIIIVGCGKVGRNLVAELSKEGHDITVIDKNATKLNELTNLYDIMGVVGNGASHATQMEAGIDKADLIIAVTDSDELNLLCCTVAKQVADCAAIARVRTPDYSQDIPYLREKLGLVMIINPEFEAAREMARILYLPAVLEVNSFAHGQAELIKFKIPAGNMLDNTSVYQFARHNTIDMLFCAVERGGEVYIPYGDFVFQAGDVVTFVAPRLVAKKFLNQIGFDTKQVRDTMIVGGGKAAYYLADQLLKNGIRVKIIENDRARCEELSTLLPKAIIINGDGTDADLLKEEGIAEAESFVPLTGIDEENIMLTLHSKQVSKAKAITKITRMGFHDVVNQLDLGSVIYPKLITAEAIIAYVRAKTIAIDNLNIETLYHLFDGRVEAIEFNVFEKSEVTNVPLKDLHLKDNLLIAFIGRKGRIIFPSGSDEIMVGDSVMIVTTHTGFHHINDIIVK